MKRGVPAAAICAIFTLFATPQFALADVRTPPPLPAGVVEQFQRDMDAFKAAMALRDQQIREINQNFNWAINQANQDARSAMQIAKKPEQKISVISVKKGAVSAAIFARESAVIALGQPPIPPVDPNRMPKNSPNQRDKQDKKEKQPR